MKKGVNNTETLINWLNDFQFRIQNSENWSDKYIAFNYIAIGKWK